MSGKLKVNVVGRIDGTTSIGGISRAFIEAWQHHYQVNFLDTRPETSDTSVLPNGVRSLEKESRDLLEAEISIFTDVTCNGVEDTNWSKVPITKLKYIYSVFDSTKIPIQWADIINTHFDAVFVPAKFLVETYRNSLVHKPVFYLPLALNLNDLLQVECEDWAADRIFKFCFIKCS